MPKRECRQALIHKNINLKWVEDLHISTENAKTLEEYAAAKNINQLRDYGTWYSCSSKY